MPPTQSTMSTVTDSQKARVTADWQQIAKEPLTIECTTVDAPVYAFGSELACLRLYAKMQGRGRVAFSQNLGSWYYCNK